MAHQDYIMEVAGPRGNVLVRVFAPDDMSQDKIKEAAFTRINSQPDIPEFELQGLMNRAVGTFYQLETMPTVNLTADPVPQLYGPQQSRPETIELFEAAQAADAAIKTLDATSVGDLAMAMIKAQPVFERLIAAVREQADKPLVGPTGKHPDGKLNATDEGGLQMAIGLDNGLVRLDFGKPVAWMAMNPHEAATFANLLLNAAAGRITGG